MRTHGHGIRVWGGLRPPHGSGGVWGAARLPMMGAILIFVPFYGTLIELNRQPQLIASADGETDRCKWEKFATTTVMRWATNPECRTDNVKYIA